MASTCPACQTPLIGSSCYNCDWTPDGHTAGTSLPLVSHDHGVGDTSPLEGWFDAPDSLGAAPNETEKGNVTFPSNRDTVLQSGSYVPGSSSPADLTSAVERGFESAAKSPNPLRDDQTRPNLGSAISKAIVGEPIYGTVRHVADPTFETASLSAFNASNQLVTGCLLAPFKAFAIVMAMFFRPLRFLFAPRMNSPTGGPNDVQVPVHRFRLQRGDTNQLVECVVRGDLVGGGVYMGDDVEIRGKFHRSTGTFVVQSMRNVATGAITTGAIDSRVRMQRVRLLFATLFVMSAIYLMFRVIT